MTGPSARAHLFEGLFPDDVVIELEDPSVDHAPVLDEEELAIARAVAKRQREFRAGRHAARRALERLGLSAVAIASDEHRAPVWPRGIVGTISHTRGLCVAAVAREGALRAIGVDVEPHAPLSAALRERVCAPAELAGSSADDDLSLGIHAKVLFSAKEAFYKAQYPLTRQYLGFHDVALTRSETESLDGTSAAFVLRLLKPAGTFALGTTFDVRVRTDLDYIATAVVIREPSR